jgi:phage terminase large subunit
VPLNFGFDFKNPDYRVVYEWRLQKLKKIRADPSVLPALKAYYREHPAQLVIDFGNTYDPRLVRRGLPAVLPFLLFPKQEELAYWIVERWKAGEPGLIEKSRDMGITWLVMSLACVMCLLNREMAIGTGSRKEDLVDRLGDPDSMLEKARLFMSGLPREFRGGWDRNDKTCSAHMRIKFPETDSIITGEAGDAIGRGGRKAIYLVDEAAHLERPHLIDASLSANTDCRIDLSSVKGMANPFAVKRFGGNIPVFSFHHTDDPRKGPEWYAQQQRTLDPVTLAQEVDMSYTASVEGVVIPNEWIRASVDAARKLGIKPTGARRGALDVADEGTDKNAFCGAHGIEVQTVEEWSGLGSDIFKTTERAFILCDTGEYEDLKYDADGLGAGVRGDANVINERRKVQSQRPIVASAFRGSAAVVDPEKEDVKSRKNEDYFANLKAQSWWRLRIRFQKTYRAVIEGHPFEPDEIISLSPQISNIQKLITELSQPTWSLNGAGKILIDKAPDGVKSPNLADSVMIQFAPGERQPIKVGAHMLANLHRM